MKLINNIISFFLNKEFMIFLLIGLFNTIFAMLVTYSIYNLLHLGYYISSFTGTFSAAVLGFFLNRKFTFSSDCKIFSSMVKFFIVILFSYLIAFTLTHKLFLYLFSIMNLGLSISVIEQIAILFAQVLFTLINFAGQKIWTFKSGDKCNERIF